MAGASCHSPLYSQRREECLALIRHFANIHYCFLLSSPKFAALFLLPLYPSERIAYEVIYLSFITSVFRCYALICGRLLISQSFLKLSLSMYSAEDLGNRSFNLKMNALEALFFEFDLEDQ